jgi:hypothetical protein
VIKHFSFIIIAINLHTVDVSITVFLALRYSSIYGDEKTIYLMMVLGLQRVGNAYVNK